MNESNTEVYEVKVGIGEEYPGHTYKIFKFNTKRACFCNAIKNVYDECVEHLKIVSENNFIWISVQDQKGEQHFDLEDELIEWLDVGKDVIL